MNETFYLISFQNIYEVLKAEKILLSLNAKIKIIPTPSKISISCGQSLKVYHELKEITLFLKEIEYQNLYKINKTFLRVSVKKIKI